ncbi:MAG: phenylalanine--tRNA ligase subunit alpha, partial [Ignavibacteriaceae bacterium]|nr:phenylalanine--tRNA ligase subunit alpha [Ignavibacteriaceae bacterium]
MKIKSDFNHEIEKASTTGEIEQVRIKYLSRNGIVTRLFDELKSISGEDKPIFGKLLNNLRTEVIESFNSKKSIIESNQLPDSARIDLTLPGKSVKIGSRHIL